MTDYKELVKTLREPCPHENCVLSQQAADAIEKLQRKVEDYETRLDLPPEAQYAIDKHADDLIACMDGMIKALDDKPMWIPVRGRLPEKDGAYLVCYGNGLITTDTFMIFEDGRTKWYDSGYDIGGVTHWMPLPTPPKEETK